MNDIKIVLFMISLFSALTIVSLIIEVKKNRRIEKKLSEFRTQIHWNHQTINSQIETIKEQSDLIEEYRNEFIKLKVLR